MTKEEFNEKWDNYWYHYKWHTLGTIFIVFCLVFTIFEYFGRKPSDFDITYIGDYMNYEGLAADITENYSELIGDINGDGVFKAEINAIYTNENIAHDSNLEFWQRIDMDLINGESYIYLVDEHLLKSFMERGANGVIKTKDGYVPYIDVTENPYLKKYLPGDKKVFLCVRKYFEYDAGEKIKKVEEKSLEFLEKILEK